MKPLGRKPKAQQTTLSKERWTSSLIHIERDFTKLNNPTKRDGQKILYERCNKYSKLFFLMKL